MLRRKPLKRGTSQLRRTRLRPRSTKQQQRHAADGAYAAAKQVVRARSRGRCEMMFSTRCTGRADDSAGPHHRWPRGKGGPDEAWNLLDCCHPCHDEVHHHRPADAYARGLLMRSRPTEKGVLPWER